MPVFRRAVSLGMLAALSSPLLYAQTRAEKKAEKNLPSYYGPQPATEAIDLTMYARIREEGLKHSHVMELGAALTDGIGPRLTGSPNMAKANAWTRDTLTRFGLVNAHLEDWGEFGMGWQQINTWARMVSPDPEPLWMQAAPWSPATPGAVKGEVVYIDTTTATLEGLDKMKGTLGGKIILLGAMRATPDITEPLFSRYTDAELAGMEKYPSSTGRAGAPPPQHSAAAGGARAADKTACRRDETVFDRGCAGDHYTQPRRWRWRRDRHHL